MQKNTKNEVKLSSKLHYDGEAERIYNEEYKKLQRKLHCLLHNPYDEDEYDMILVNYHQCIIYTEICHLFEKYNNIFTHEEWIEKVNEMNKMKESIKYNMYMYDVLESNDFSSSEKFHIVQNSFQFFNIIRQIEFNHVNKSYYIIK